MDSTMFFKRGGNYMIRSAKRPGLSSPSPRGGRPPKRHILYKLLTILLLVLCWPVGLVMLWLRRPIRWSAAVKLLVSALSLALVFALLSVGLVYDFSNPRLQSAQQRVNLAITAARDRFLASIDAQQTAISGYYNTFQLLPGEDAVQAALEIQMRGHAAWLCALISGALTAREGGI